MKVYEAERVAYTAHGACGQMRANGTTPYITHPRKVALYTQEFSEFGDLKAFSDNRNDRIVAALLHDVLEDTKLTRPDLLYLGISYKQLDIVERLTKPDNGPAQPAYYQRIAENDDALVVKCADRCANLDDALAELEVEEPTEPRRWGRYVEKTYRDVLPMYKTLPYLHQQLVTRLEAIEAALPASLERRAAAVARWREASGIVDARTVINGPGAKFYFDGENSHSAEIADLDAMGEAFADPAWAVPGINASSID
jgi:hypothetical protein